MRYTLMLITGLMLMACNLSAPDTQPAIEATATPDKSVEEQTGNIIFWQSLGIGEVTPTEDDIVIIEQIVLRRMETAIASTGNPVDDIEQSLQMMLGSHNLWNSESLTIDSVEFSDSQATIHLGGRIQAPGDIVLIAARQQMLLTLFEIPQVDSILMTVSGLHIMNIGISHDSQAVPDNHALSREVFYTELGYTP